MTLFTDDGWIKLDYWGDEIADYLIRRGQYVQIKLDVLSGGWVETVLSLAHFMTKLMPYWALRHLLHQLFWCRVQTMAVLLHHHRTTYTQIVKQTLVCSDIWIKLWFLSIHVHYCHYCTEAGSATATASGTCWKAGYDMHSIMHVCDAIVCISKHLMHVRVSVKRKMDVSEEMTCLAKMWQNLQKGTTLGQS